MPRERETNRRIARVDFVRTGAVGASRVVQREGMAPAPKAGSARRAAVRKSQTGFDITVDRRRLTMRLNATIAPPHRVPSLLGLLAGKRVRPLTFRSRNQRSVPLASCQC